jgi:putative colanic acid biosynthesis UDP-glucose lipid carrier transferase
MTHIRSATRPSPGITPWDPSSVFVIKSLLYPLAATGSLALALLICREPFDHAYFLTAVLAFLAMGDFLDAAPLQHGAARSSAPRGLVNIAMRWFVVVGFIWVLIAVSDLREHFESRVLLTWAGITPLVLWLSQLGTQAVLHRLDERFLAPRNAVIIGHNPLGELLADKLQADRSLRIRVLGYFDDRSAEEKSIDKGPAILGEPAQLPGFMFEHGVQIVYITWPMAREARILELLELLRDSTASIYFVPDVSVANLIQGRVDLVSGIPVVGVCESPFYGIRGLAKRLCDIVLSSAVLVAILPVLIAVAIGVRLSSPGPVVFRQRRYGLDGKEITVYKFRSMRVTEDGDKSYTQVTRNDSRVTAFGAFIRRTSLDELPQLFNVLEGGMSLVGPRPHAIAVNEQYRRMISGYMIRHKVKPGITGWAQVNGFRGGDDLESMRQRVEADLEYLRNWSLRLDIAIILKTLTLMWADRRAF